MSGVRDRLPDGRIDHRTHERDDIGGTGWICLDCSTEEADVEWTIPYDIHGRPLRSDWRDLPIRDVCDLVGVPEPLIPLSQAREAFMALRLSEPHVYRRGRWGLPRWHWVSTQSLHDLYVGLGLKECVRHDRVGKDLGDPLGLRAVEQESRAQLRAEKAYAARGRRLGLNVGKTMRPRGQRGTWRDGGSPC